MSRYARRPGGRFSVTLSVPAIRRTDGPLPAACATGAEMKPVATKATEMSESDGARAAPTWS